MSYVLDASAGVELLLRSPIGTALEPKVPGGIAWVPEIYFAEVAAGLRPTGARRRHHRLAGIGRAR